MAYEDYWCKIQNVNEKRKKKRKKEEGGGRRKILRIEFLREKIANYENRDT